MHSLEPLDNAFRRLFSCFPASCTAKCCEPIGVDDGAFDAGANSNFSSTNSFLSSGESSPATSVRFTHSDVEHGGGGGGAEEQRQRRKRRRRRGELSRSRRSSASYAENAEANAHQAATSADHTNGARSPYNAVLVHADETRRIVIARPGYVKRYRNYRKRQANTTGLPDTVKEGERMSVSDSTRGESHTLLEQPCVYYNGPSCSTVSSRTNSQVPSRSTSVQKIDLPVLRFYGDDLSDGGATSSSCGIGRHDTTAMLLNDSFCSSSSGFTVTPASLKYDKPAIDERAEVLARLQSASERIADERLAIADGTDGSDPNPSSMPRVDSGLTMMTTGAGERSHDDDAPTTSP